MRCSNFALCFSLLLVAGWNLQADPPQNGGKPALNVDQDKIQQLIQNLGSPKFIEREKAAKALEAFGPAALDLLRQAMKNPEAEISCRAGKIVSKLENQVLAATMLAPKKVHLVLKHVPVPDAVAELARLSGYKLELTGDSAGLKNRKVTLDTGTVTFWQAFEQLCQQAGLVEKVNLSANPPQAGPGNFPMKGGWNPNGQPAAPAANPPILLMEGKQTGPAYLAGALRVSVVPSPKDGAAVPPGVAQITLDVTAEPRLKDFGVIAAAIIEKAIDDQDQLLAMAAPPKLAPANPLHGGGGGAQNIIINKGGGGNVIIINGGGNIVINGNGGVVIVNGQVIGPDGMPMGQQQVQRTVPVRFNIGTKPAKTLKELSGTLLLQTLKENDKLVTVDNILQAAGKTVIGLDGSTLHVKAVEKVADGSLKIQVVKESPASQNPFGPWVGGNININGMQINNGLANGGTANFPKLVDAKGTAYPPAEVLSSQTNFNGGKSQHHATLIYRPHGAAAQLVQYGDRVVTFSVPFTLKDVPLP